MVNRQRTSVKQNQPKAANQKSNPTSSPVKQQAAAPVVDAKPLKKLEQRAANKAAQAPKKVKDEENELLKAMAAHKKSRSQTPEPHHHLEKNVKNAMSSFAVFEKREVKRLRAENPGLRPTQYKSKVQV